MLTAVATPMSPVVSDVLLSSAAKSASADYFIDGQAGI